jgi:carbonic anhydrase
MSIIEVNTVDDLFPVYKGTPIEDLFKYNNMDYPFETYTNAKILISMCMDNRKQLRIPGNFAYIMRTGAGNLRFSEFKVSYAIAIGDVSCIALIAHNNCGMVNLFSKKDKFIKGMMEKSGWDKQKSEEYFMTWAPIYEISDEIHFVLLEVNRLRRMYPKILIAPLFYKLEDNRLYLVEEKL